MAETKDLAQALEEMKSKAPEVYNEIIGRYNQSELLNNEALFNDFVKLYDQSVADRKKGQQVLDAAIEANSSEEQTPPNTQDDRTPIENTQALENLEAIVAESDEPHRIAWNGADEIHQHLH